MASWQQSWVRMHNENAKHCGATWCYYLVDSLKGHAAIPWVELAFVFCRPLFLSFLFCRRSRTARQSKSAPSQLIIFNSSLTYAEMRSLVVLAVRWRFDYLICHVPINVVFSAPTRTGWYATRQGMQNGKTTCVCRINTCPVHSGLNVDGATNVSDVGETRKPLRTTVNHSYVVVLTNSTMTQATNLTLKLD